MHRFRILVLVLLTSVALPSLLASTASAEISVGDRAPDFEGKDFFNCEEASLRALRGRVVLFELFSTG